MSPTPIKLAVARELAAAGSLRTAVLVGQSGGYTVRLGTDAAQRVLATKDSAPRVFPKLQAAAKVLDELGVRRYEVDASRFEPAATRHRPDRAEAMREKELDAKYMDYLRQAVLESRADPGPPVSSEEAARRMERLYAQYRQQMDESLSKRA